MGCCSSSEKDEKAGNFDDLEAMADNKKNGAKGPKKEAASNGTAKLSSYATAGSSQPAPTESVEHSPTLVPEPEAEEPAVRLKAAPRSNIVEARSKPVDAKKPAQQQQQTEPAKKPAPILPVPPDSSSNRAGPPTGNALAACLSDALANISTAPSASRPAAGLDVEEEKIKEETRRLKEQLKHEVQGPKSGFGGFDAPEEPKQTPPKSVIATEAIQECVLDTSDTPLKEARTPVKERTASGPEADFPSSDWFEANGFQCPAVCWWQDKHRLGIDIKVDSPSETSADVEGENVLVFKCKGGDKLYGLRLHLQAAVVGAGMEVSTSKNCAEVIVTKKDKGMWGRQLIIADRKGYMGLDWISYDMAKSADDDDDDEDDSD